MDFDIIANAVLSFIYPPKCLLCGEIIAGKAQDRLCFKCAVDVAGLPPVRCEKREGCAYDAIYGLWPYEGRYSRAVLDLKFNNKLENGKILGIICAEDIMKKHLLTDINIIIPVPLHRSKMVKRGYNQAEIIAREAGRRLGITTCAGCVKRIKKTVPQMDLNLEQRMVNLEGAMKVTEPTKVEGKNILLIDDIFTTGSTLNECAKELKKNGAKAVSCYCICVSGESAVRDEGFESSV